MAWAKILFKPVMAVTTGAASTYLAQQVYQYEQFKKKMQPMSPKLSPERIEVMAHQKEWLVWGRQSPGYARDDKPKMHLRDKINRNPLTIAELGTHLDNEKHYELLPGSDFVTIPCTQDKKAPRVLIKPEQMIGVELHDIPEDQQFEVHFARKQAFAKETNKKSPFYHSSFALRQVSEERPANPQSVVISGKQAKALIEDINETICAPQHCTMIDSNCYSASVYGLGALAKIIDQDSRDESTKKRDLQSIADVVTTVSLDNFGRGVTNNAVVNTQLTSELPALMSKYGLIHTDTEQHLSKRTFEK